MSIMVHNGVTINKDTRSIVEWLVDTDIATDTEPFVFNESHHSARLLAGLRHLRDCSQLFDVTLVAEGQEFQAHRVVLASCSDYFHAMFTNGLKETSQHSIVLNGVTASAIEQLIHFAYTSKLKISKENVVAVLSGASHVQMLPAIHACETYLSSRLSMDNCLQLESLADVYSLKDLQRKVHCFICQHWLQFSTSPDFLSLSSVKLQGILRSDFPVYCSEVEIIRAILIWVSHDLEQRLPSLRDLLSLVKVMPERQLPESLQQLLTSPGVRSVMGACPELQTWLSRLGGRDVKTVDGVVNTRGYEETLLLVGGFHRESPADITNSVLRLNTELHDLLPYQTIPHVKQTNFGAAVLANRLYVVGGCCSDDFLELTHPFGFSLDPTSGTWTRLPPMSQERCRFYLGALGGRLYAVGGEVDNSQLLASCEVFDPVRSSWSPIAPLPATRSELAGTALGGRLYVSGGEQDQFERTQNQLWCYQPELDRWTQLAPMIQPRADHTMFAFHDRLYVMGGWCKTDGDRIPLTTVDCYDPDTDRWETVQQLKAGRRHSTCTLFHSLVYVIGGGIESNMDLPRYTEMDILDLETMTWLPDPPMLPPIREHIALTIHLPKTAEQTSGALL